MAPELRVSEGPTGFRLIPVAIEDLAAVWETIEADLRRAQSKVQAQWTPETVALVLANNNATLYLGWLDGEYVGFVILAQALNGTTGDVMLVIWVAHTLNRQIRDLALAEIEQLARSNGARSVRFHSPRFRAWDRVAHRIGYQCVEKTYEKLIYDG